MSFQADAFQNDAFQIEGSGNTGAYLLGTYVDKHGFEFCIALIAALSSFVI